MTILENADNCGSAAAQCGKPMAFRSATHLIFPEAAPQENVLKLLATVRQSLTALCGGEAAVYSTNLIPALKNRAKFRPTLRVEEFERFRHIDKMAG